MMSIGGPAGDKGILANPVIFHVYKREIMRSEFRHIYDIERGSTEIWFEDNFEPMTFGI